MEEVVTSFYGSWLVQWQQASQSLECLKEEFLKLTTGDAGFTWIHKDGVTTHGFECKSTYGCRRSAEPFRVEIREFQVLPSQSQKVVVVESSDIDNDVMVTFQVWTTHDSSALSVLQVTAWLTTAGTDESWKISRLQETDLPAGDAIIPPWKSTICVPSRRRHLHPNLDLHGARPLMMDNDLVIGISLGGWNIGTSQGSIGDATWLEQAVGELEPASQYCHRDAIKIQGKRQLALPEMVFPHAYTALEYTGVANDAASTILLSWTAMDFLKDWASAHQAIPWPSSSQAEEGGLPPMETKSVSSSRGVSVLESSDAMLWKQKTKNDDGAEGITSTTFHYDWTYSSPYTDTTIASDAHWKPLQASGMPMHLLMDRSVPILFFDSLHLVEDDMHDNGQMQYTLKLRVMPTCIYVLTQLFIRVDQVLLRVRETRVLVELTASDKDNRDARKIYRDVSWRECAWNELASRGLPDNVKAWTFDEQQQQPQEAAAFAQLLQRLPLVDLPDEISAHAELVYQPMV